MGKRAGKKTLSIDAGADGINESRLIAIILIIVSFAVYFNVLFNDFVWDDDMIALSASKLQQGLNLRGLLTTSGIWEQGPSNYYRPMIGITHTLAYYIFGFKPWAFHLLNMLFHTGVSVLAFFVVLQLSKDHGPPNINYNLPALWAALFFAVHPIHSESVAWVSGITDPSYSFFYLLSFYLYLQATPDKDTKKGMYFVSLISFFIATLYKEPAVTLPAVLIAYDLTLRKDSSSRLLELAKRQLPYIIVAGMYFALRSHALSGFATGPVRHSELSAPEHFINVFPFFMEYLCKLVLPVNLSAFYVLHPITSIFEMKGIIPLVVAALFIIITVASIRQNKAVFFSLVLIVVPLLPALYIRATGPGSFAERYLYLSVLGLALLLTLFYSWAAATMSSKSTIIMIVFAVLIGLFATETIYRNAVWRNDYTLWSDAVQKSPDGALPRHNLGTALLAGGRVQEAIDQYKVVLELSPDDYDTHNNLGAAYVKQGSLQEAQKEYEIALRLRPDIATTHGNLGNVYRVSGAVDKAIEECGTAVKLAPNDAYAHNNLGLALAKKGLMDRAVEHLETAARLKPDDPALRSDLDQVIALRKNRR